MPATIIAIVDVGASPSRARAVRELEIDWAGVAVNPADATMRCGG